jgi:Sperm-tail PG-rich repeat
MKSKNAILSSIPLHNINTPRSTTHKKNDSYPNNASTSSSTKMFGLVKGKKQNLKELQSSPGPGAYHYELEIGGVSYGIGRSKRCHDRKQTFVGPGSYDLKLSPSKISYSMTPRRRQLKKIENVPGPGAYNPGVTGNGIMFSIMKADRNKARVIESPGPGAYTIDKHSISRSALYWLCRTIRSQRPPLSQIIDTPGPGSYHYEIKIGGPDYTLGNKHDFKSKSIEPVVSS